MKTILLSAGHGGSDPGAVGNGLKEADCNLKITLACRDYLNKNYSEHKLVLARDRDIYISLPARRNLAVGVKADLYVSLHNNAFNNPTARGFESFCHNGPLFGTTLQYREILHETVYSYLKLQGVPDRGMKRANHWVTREMPCPTVLMEYLFITSPTDAELMKRIGFLEKLGELTGEGIARALKLPARAAQPPQQEEIWYRVIAGSYRSKASAEVAKNALQASGFNAFIEARRDEDL